MLDTWWVWIVAGILIGALEIVIPGYVFVGFAVGAIVTGGLLWFGVLGTSTAVTFGAFAVLSLVAWFAIRKALGPLAGKTKTFTRDINDP